MNGPSEKGVGKSDEDSTSVYPTRRTVNRRELLKGIAGGSALVAAARPIESLATSPTVLVAPNGKVCTVSGMQSAGASVKPNSAVCGGKGPAFYSDVSNWPAQPFAVSGKTFKPNSPVMDTDLACRPLFKYAGGDGSTRTLLQLMTGGDSPERHWLCAVLNARKFPTTFPYTDIQVMAFYNASGTTHTNALTFFSTTPGLEAP